MSQANRLSSRRSEFVSIRQLVLAIAGAEKRPPAEIATSLWNLLSESESSPEWLQHQDGVTYRLELIGQETGLFALRALMEGREYRGWEHKMGFSREQIRNFFESRGFSFPTLNLEITEPSSARAEKHMAPGPERDEAMLRSHEKYRAAGERNFLERVVADFGVSRETVKKCLRNARKKRPAPSISLDDAWANDFAKRMR